MEGKNLNNSSVIAKAEAPLRVARDLREFNEQLVREGDLVTIDKSVTTEHEIAAYIRKSCKTGGPALLFTHLAGQPDLTVAGGTYPPLNPGYIAVRASQQ